jgi:tellurite resistance protein TerC
VPKQYQQKVLLIGVAIAIVMRGIFIALGAAIIENFSWIFYIFGFFLIYTAIHLAKQGEMDDDDYHENKIVTMTRRLVPLTDTFHGTKLSVMQAGKRMFTPMLIVMIAIGSTDILFALDSIPAIYGLTQEPYLVFTANVFALMGLRQLYFLLGGLMERLIYLKHGLSLILAFIGVKLILHAMHENELPFINGGQHIEWAPEIPTFVSLGVIVAIIVVATVASMVSPKGRAAHAVAELHRAIEVYRGIPEGTPTTEIRLVQAELVKKHHAARGAAERSTVELPDLHEHTGKTADEHHTESQGETRSERDLTAGEPGEGGSRPPLG